MSRCRFGVLPTYFWALQDIWATTRRCVRRSSSLRSPRAAKLCQWQAVDTCHAGLEFTESEEIKLVGLVSAGGRAPVNPASVAQETLSRISSSVFFSCVHHMENMIATADTFGWLLRNHSADKAQKHAHRALIQMGKCIHSVGSL